MAVSHQDVSSLYNLLQKALSQDEGTRKEAEAALTSCEARPGFCLCLLEIIGSPELRRTDESRWLAVVYFKNSTSRYWRSRRDSSGISPSEKALLREKLLELLQEDNNKVAAQLSLSVAKIARFDYPNEWPQLFPSLLGKIQSSNALLTHRAYLTLNLLLKELSSKRLAADQKRFHEITTQLYEYSWHHWCNDTQAVMHAISSTPGKAALTQDDERSLSLACERWMLCLKVLKRMLIFGFPSDAKSVKEVPAVQSSAPAFLQAVQSFRQSWPVLEQQQHALAPFVASAMLKLMRVLTSIQATHPYSFGGQAVMTPLIEFCYGQVIEVPAAQQPPPPPQLVSFLIECMVFLKSVLSCLAYRQTKTGRVLGVEASIPSVEETKGRLAGEAQRVLQAFFDQKKVMLLCGILVERYFVLTQEDLEAWSSDPEGFAHEQSMLQWRDSLRPCAEALYLTLFENYREILAPVMLETLKQAVERCPPAPLHAEVELTPALLFKEAAYNAVGAAHHDLHDMVDFRSWYHGALSLEIQNSSSNGRILRRRVAVLFGQWVAKITGDLRGPVYASLVLLLQEKDVAVQLVTCHSLRNLIDDLNFYEDDFVQYADACLQLLFQLVHLASEYDTKLQVFELITLIVERLGAKIVPYAVNIMSFLPQVWQQSEGQSLLRMQVLLALQRLLNALGPQSTITYDLLFPMLQYCTDVKQPDELNMLEDGMQLWLATLRHAPAMVPPLMALFPHLVEVMDRNFDHLQVSMKIIESYIFLGGADFLRHHAQGVVKILDGVVGNVKEKGMMVTLPVVDTLVQCFPTEAPAALEHVLQKLLVLVVASRDDPDIVKASSAAILARVLLQNSAFFVKFISDPSLSALLQQQSVVAGGASPLILFLDAWLEKIDAMTTTGRRKVSALALCIMLELREPQVLERLEQIISTCTSVIHETQAEKEGAKYGYDYWVSPVNTEDDGGSPSAEGEGQRRRQVFSADPVNNLSLAALLKEKLQVCAAVYGEAVFNSAMNRVHSRILAQLQECLPA